METRYSGHTSYRTQYHIVWNTKYHRPTLSVAMQNYLAKLFIKILSGMPVCEIIASNILIDHIHLVMVIPPKYSVKTVVGNLKGQTSSMLKKHFSSLNNNNSIWSRGYFVSTVGIPEEKILDYVKNQ